MSEGAFGSIPAQPSFSRRAVAELSRSMFPQKVEHVSPDALQKATEFVKDGGGLIIAYTHLSGREGSDILTWLLRQPLLNTKKIISPVSYHTYNKNVLIKLGYTLEAWAAGIKFFPLITPESMGKLSPSEAIPNKGLIDYLQAAGETLNEGGIVPVALQAQGNTGILGEPTPALSAITRTVEKYPDNKTGILFVGLELPDESGNSVMHSDNDIKKMHLSRMMNLRVGRFLTLDEAKQGALEDQNPIQIPGKKIRGLDSFGFKNLASLLSPRNVSPIYLRQ